MNALQIAFVFAVWKIANTANGAEAESCDCTDYWSCVLKDGFPSGYCDPSETKICCYIAKNARTIGIAPSTLTRTPRCGNKGSDSGLNGVSEWSEWPWHAAILEKSHDLYICGGSLLDERWVLTAAHCVDDFSNAELLKVRLGEYDVTSTNETLPYEEFGVIQIVIHPDFGNSTLVNDVALLQLDHKVKKRPHIDIVCLPDNWKEDSRQKCFVTGWGRHNESSRHSVVLKEIRVPLWSHEACQHALRSHFGQDFVLASTTLCAGADGRDACDGDGGGPLVCEKEGVWYQVGIVSFGLGCGRRHVPGVYARVPMFSDWIKSIVRRFA